MMRQVHVCSIVKTLLAGLTSSLGCGTQIDSIEKSHASLTSVPDDVLRSYRTLEECKLDANQIKELPNAFFRLEKIRILSVSDNELTRIPPGIGNFSYLVELDISRNDISELPTSLSLCDSLQILDASNNALKMLPEGFSQLRSLRVLSLNDVSLYELPADFGGLKKLQKLELRDNYLNSLPVTFGDLASLEFLDLGGNDFVTLPPSIGSLQNLLELWLDDNQMTSLPDEIGNLHALQQMDASENRLTSLPPTIAGLTSLSDLNLTQNFLDCLPDEIGQLGSLSVFKLNRNQLVDLTPAIGRCQNLLEFYLTENYLSALPNTIGNLTKMFHFNVTKNQLVELPPEIGKCVALQILSLRDNNLRRIPSEVGNLTQLHVLDLAGNRLDRLPVSLTSCPLKALWLVQSQAQPISLQRAVDENSGEEYLTCYLLPQEADDNVFRNGLPSSNASSPGATSNQFKKELESTNGTLLPTTQIPSGTSSIVNLGDEKEVGEGQEEGEEDGATPEATSASARVRFTAEEVVPKAASDASAREYPKTRHPMHLKKATLDGELVHKVSDNTPFLPSNGPGLQPKADQNTSHGRLQEYPVPVFKPLDIQGGDPSMSMYLRHQDGPKRILGPSSAANTSPLYANTHPSNRIELVSDYVGSLSSDLGSPTSTGSSGGIDDLLSPNATTSAASASVFTRPRRHGAEGGVAFADTPDEHQPVSDKGQEEDEEQAYSSGGEEIDTITKSVAFSDEVIDNEDNASLKLIRRDTPHYTKRARIHMNNEEAVLKLLKKYHDPSVVDAFADDSAPENMKTTSALLMVAAAAAAASGSGGGPVTSTYSPFATDSHIAVSPAPAPTPQQPPPPKTEQVTLHVTLERVPGGGLGLSIAGGVGSVPFRGLDQGIFVSRLAPGGLAEVSGLKVGDKLLEVNGVSMVNVEHQVAVSALRTDATRFKLLLCREVPVITQPPSSDFGAPTSAASPAIAPTTAAPPPYVVNPQRAHNLPSSLLNTTSLGRNIPNATVPFVQATPMAMQLIRCTLHRDWSGLGFSIAGGRGLLGPQADPSAHLNFLETIYISRIVEGGAADKAGKLRIGDQLFKINGIDVRNARHDQVITLLTGAGPNVELEVLRKLTTPITPNASCISVSGEGGLSRTPSLVEGPQFLRKEEGLDVYRVTLRHRPGKSLGLRICGGCDTSSLPFGGDSPGVFICRVQEGGEAREAGLRVGDRLLSVNGRDLRRVTHDEAVAALMPSGFVEESLLLEIRRDPSPPGLREVVITCPPEEPLGLNLMSLRLTVPSPAHSCTLSGGKLVNEETEGIFVRQITPDSPIARDGRVKPGDRLLVANSEWVMSLEPQELAEVLHSQEGTLSLTLCDGIDLSTFGEVFSSRQPIFSNLSCHLIDCDGKVQECVRPLKPHFGEMVERIRPLIEKPPGEGVRPLVVQKYVPLPRRQSPPKILKPLSPAPSVLASPAEMRNFLVPSTDVAERYSVVGSSRGALAPPSKVNAHHLLPQSVANNGSEFDSLVTINTPAARAASRPKRAISAALMERIRRWQADRDRAEGITRPPQLRTPRFAVHSTTVSSGISEASFTASEKPLEPCVVEGSHHLLRQRQQQKSRESSSNSLSEQNTSSESEETEDVSSMVPVVAQFIEVQSNPTLYGSPLDNVFTNFCGWRPKCVNVPGESVEAESATPSLKSQDLSLYHFFLPTHLCTVANTSNLKLFLRSCLRFTPPPLALSTTCGAFLLHTKTWVEANRSHTCTHAPRGETAYIVCAKLFISQALMMFYV
ncbi:Leucine-rich repeat-containing protein 1 [Taenia crassiceps]|uniref:Leucine-rich repeat-containing protein 1 n=1 Tax=Taenia crassiceps TaxID=6207 RepID=A0ABR4QLU1_9CEST